MASDSPLPHIDTSVAHAARVYDYWLGGKDNFAADRALGDAMVQAIPTLPTMAKANRAFLGRAVRWLAAKGGIASFSISARGSRRQETPMRSPKP